MIALLEWKQRPAPGWKRRPVACLCTWAYLVALFLLVGCQSGPRQITDDDKLTRDEYVALVNTCRGTLLNAKLDLTEAQRTFIREQAPTFRIDYVGHKKGKYTMTWETPEGLGASVIGDGKILDSSCRVRISVVHF
jgi:hypothetical protein